MEYTIKTLYRGATISNPMPWSASGASCKDSSLAWVLLGRVELRGEGQIDYRAQRQWPVYFKELILSFCELIPVGGIHWLKGVSVASRRAWLLKPGSFSRSTSLGYYTSG
jgi:hypothetical protein